MNYDLMNYDLAQVWNAKSVDCAVVVSSHLTPVAPSNLCMMIIMIIIVIMMIIIIIIMSRAV